MKKAFLNRKELAQELAITPGTVTRWVEQGIIPCIKIGQTYRFQMEKVVKALEKFEQRATA